MSDIHGSPWAVHGHPAHPLSLDVLVHDGGSLPHEWLAALHPARDEPLNLDRLSDEVLEGVLFQARQAADFSQRMLTRYWDTIQTDKRIIRLAANGHTNASIAKLLSPPRWLPNNTPAHTHTPGQTDPDPGAACI
jgi:hypothetical protein